MTSHVETTSLYDDFMSNLDTPNVLYDEMMRSLHAPDVDGDDFDFGYCKPGPIKQDSFNEEYLDKYSGVYADSQNILTGFRQNLTPVVVISRPPQSFAETFQCLIFELSHMSHFQTSHTVFLYGFLTDLGYKCDDLANFHRDVAPIWRARLPVDAQNLYRVWCNLPLDNTNDMRFRELDISHM